MAKPTTVTIAVDRAGTMKTDFLNFTGSACMETGRQLHALLAEFGLETEVTSFVPKPELSGAAAELMVSQGETLQEGEPS